jgi:hypothetical protein
MRTLNRFFSRGDGWVKDLPDQRDHARDGVGSAAKPGNFREKEWPYSIAKFKTKPAVADGHALVSMGCVDPTQRFIVRNSGGAQWGRTVGVLRYFTLPYADGCGAVWPVIFGRYAFWNDAYEPN